MWVSLTILFLKVAINDFTWLPETPAICKIIQKTMYGELSIKYLRRYCSTCILVVSSIWYIFLHGFAGRGKWTLWWGLIMMILDLTTQWYIQINIIHMNCYTIYQCKRCLMINSYKHNKCFKECGQKERNSDKNTDCMTGCGNTVAPLHIPTTDV